jgi:hypothetical protein
MGERDARSLDQHGQGSTDLQPNTILLLISVNDVSAYEFRRHRHLDRRWPARPCADRVMTYALALARAVVAMRVEDYFQIG